MIFPRLATPIEMIRAATASVNRQLYMLTC